MQITRKTGHYVTTVFGGTPYGPQINEIRRGTDVLIATPGRLNDLMNKGVVDLGGIKSLVLDEADRMLDMGFLPAVTTIVDATPADRQTLLFSATIDHSIQKNLGSLLNDPAVVEIARNGETAQTVEQFMMPIANFKKPELLQALLEEKGSDRVIVFARTKNRTEDCAEALCDAGYRAESIHSDKSQGQRKRALPTSVAAARQSSWRPTCWRAASTYPTWTTSSTSTCPTCPRTTCTASAARVAPESRASRSRSSRASRAAR